MRKEAEQELIQAGIVTSDELHAAKEKSRSNRISILLNLLEGRSSESCNAITETLAQHYKIPLLSLNKIAPPHQIMKLCNPKQARKLHFLPVAEHGDKIVVGMVDPLDLHYSDEIRAIFQRPVQAVFISMGDFEHNYYRFFRKGIDLPSENPAMMNTAALKKAFLGSDEAGLSGDEKAAIAKKFASTIIAKALSGRASSFSIEPQQDVSLVNLTLDGTEYNLFRFSISNHKAMVDAMMKLAKIDPPHHEGVDQFSRCQIKYRDRQYILAYSFRHTPTGDRVIVHILDPNLNEISIDKLGLSKRSVDQLKQTMEEPGIILLTGPSGSGKSTLLQVLTRYAVLQKKSVFTVEDIVGLKIEGARQFQIKPQGPSKSQILKALQKKDADVIVVDECDRETLPAVLDAVEGGSLLLLSITAPDIGEAISRLLRTGVSRSRLATALKLVNTHKVLRKLCSNCKTRAETHPTTISQWQIPEHLQFQTGNGCETCHDSGYQGTLSLTEQLAVSPHIAELIRAGASGPELFEEARSEGMLTLIEQGLNKAIDGATSLEEVLASIPSHRAFSVKSRMRMGRIMPLNKMEREKGKKTPIFKPTATTSMNPEKSESEAADSSITFSDFTAASGSTPEIIKEEDKQPEPATAAPQAEEDNGRANILLVDDSPVTLEFTRHILDVSGYFNVDATDTAAKALEMLQEKQYHLVITDQEMPEQTGQEFIESIRQHPSLNSVGTILLTGNLNEMSALEGGADGYIAKPTDPELLIARAKSISDIYRRLSGAAPAKPAAPASLQTPASTSSTPGKVEFTEQDLAKVGSFELDIAVPGASESETPAAARTAAGDDGADTSEFESLFK